MTMTSRAAMSLRAPRCTLLCMLLCVLLCFAATAAPPQPDVDANNLRALRPDNDIGAQTQVKKNAPNDIDDNGDGEDGEDAQQLPAKQHKQTHPDAALLEKPLAKSTGRPIHRVYDPLTGLFCELEGDCHACPVSEKDETYCRETGYRQEMRCPQSPETSSTNDRKSTTTMPPKATTALDNDLLLTEVRFKACVPRVKANPFTRVLLFELVMASALAGAFVLVRKEQQKHLSSFDLRKDPRQRSALLGSSGGSSSGHNGSSSKSTD